MNNRERTSRILHFQSVDRFPAVHFGYWRELLTEWEEQGHISRELAKGVRDANEYDRELDKILGWDFNRATTKGANTRLFPAFENLVLETLPDGTQRVQNSYGVIDRLLPTWIENGINVMFPIEIGVWGDQFEAASSPAPITV